MSDPVEPRKPKVVFTRHEYAYRATPGNVVIDLAQGDPSLVVFRNLTGGPVVASAAAYGESTETDTTAARSAALFAEAIAKAFSQPLPDGESVEVPLADLREGQYFYRAYVIGCAGLEIQGGSGPGIIITR
jgi:hypothetical protein